MIVHILLATHTLQVRVSGMFQMFSWSWVILVKSQVYVVIIQLSVQQNST